MIFLKKKKKKKKKERKIKLSKSKSAILSYFLFFGFDQLYQQLEDANEDGDIKSFLGI